MARKRRQKPKIKPIIAAKQDYDVGTPEIHQREITETRGAERKKFARVLSAPLDYYFNREWLTEDQHNAGRQFLHIWRYGGGSPNVKSMDLLRVSGIHGDGSHHAAMRDRYARAIQSFRGHAEKSITFEVTCLGEYADEAMRSAIRAALSDYTSPRRGMIYLRNGLDDLIAHFTRRRSNNSIDRGSIEK